MTDKVSKISGTGWRGTFMLFAAAAIVVFFVTDVVLPRLAERVPLEPVLLWFAMAGLVLFPILLLTGWSLLRQEGAGQGPRLWRERLRFRPMDGTDWLWSAAAIAGMGAASAILLAGLRRLFPELELTPWFLEMEPLAGDRLWILAAWLPFFVLNIFTEEVVWRGVVLPRQEVALGSTAWLANGTGWLLFHLAFGPAMLVMLLPIVTILPWVVQRRGNTWVGVVVHAALNGPGFLAMAFGWV